MNEIISKKVIPSKFYGQVMSWLFIAFAVSAASAVIIAPYISVQVANILMISLVVVMLFSALTKMLTKYSNFFTILIPAIMGVSLAKIIDSYVAAGSANIVILALITTSIVFAVVAVFAWTSKKTAYHLLGRMFMILLAIIVISFLNIFIFKFAILELMIAIGGAILFAVYTFIDIQAMRDKYWGDDVPPSFYALNIFLDLVNLFLFILRIFSSR